MNTATHYYYAGMGAAADTAVQMSTSLAGAVVPTAIGPSVAALLGISTAAAIPVVGAAIAGIGMAIEAILHSGCGETCIVTSQWANQAEGYLQQNISQYFAIATPRPQSVQQLALANFQAIWNTLQQQCSQPGLGTAGQNCIKDRQAGSCKWKAQPPQYPGEPAAGSCWNWWNAYHDPIANDPNVVADSSGIGSSILGGGSSNLLLVGAAVAGVVLLLSLS